MRRPDAAWKAEAGFTLAELLVSTVVTLMVLGAALGAFADAMRITDTARETTDTNQNIEVAMTLMVRDFIQAGSQGFPIGGVPIPSGSGAVALNRPAPAGSSLTFPATYEVMPAIAPGGGLGTMVLGVTTDMVTIMYVDPESPDITINGDAGDPGSISADGSTMTVPAGANIAGADGIQEGDLLFFDGGKKALQMVTGVSGRTVSFGAGDDLKINQRGAASGTILQLADDGVYPLVEVKRVLMVSYYIDVVTDPALPRLVRQVNNGPRLAIALGIENLQITYDLVDGTTNPTNVETPASPYSPHQIRKANLFLAGRSLDVNPRTRQFFRNTAATQVSLRSLTFVDRYTPADEDQD
jgi:type II secretory pathway pseudopilin PulG